MKRKLFILGTLGLAGLFAGGVVAAYTITDNANSQGIKITPGQITDDEVGNVTLEWGDMTEFTNVSGLSASSSITRTVNVKATKYDDEGHEEANAVYLGKLDIELKDLSGKAASAERLIDYLHVIINGYAYENNAFANEKSELGEIPTEGEGAFSTSLSVYSNSTGKPVDFVISLDAKAVPVMSQIMSDQVYLTVDWNRAENGDTGLKHVFIPAGDGWADAMYVYAYSANGGQNAEWPGVQLTKDVTTGLFEGDISEHDFYIFNDNTGGHQYPASGKDGMTKASINFATATAKYFDWSTHAFTATEPVVSASYYLVSAPSWATQAAFGFENADAENEDARVAHQFKLVASVEADVEYKLCGNAWVGYSAIENPETGFNPRSLVEEGADDNFTFKAAGSYTIYVKEWNDGGHSIYIVNPNA